MGSLSGTLAAFGVVDVLQLLASTGASGVLRITGAERAVVFCADGCVTRAASRADDGLGAALVQAGLLGAAELDAAAANGGSGLADALRGLTGADAERLERILRHRTEEALFEIGGWREGEFQLDPDGAHVLGEVFRYPIADLLAAVAARTASWPAVQALVPSLDAVVEPTPGPAGEDGQLLLTRAQFRVLTAIDGSRTVREVALKLGDGIFETTRALSGLVEGGLVAFGPERPMAATVPASQTTVAGAVPAALATAPAAPSVANGARATVPANGVAAANGTNGAVNGGGATPRNGAALNGAPANGSAVNGAAKGSARLAPSATVDLTAAAPPPPAAVPVAGAAVPGLPTEFATGDGRPDRGLVLKLLSAVKELQVTDERQA